MPCMGHRVSLSCYNRATTFCAEEMKAKGTTSIDCLLKKFTAFNLNVTDLYVQAYNNNYYRYIDPAILTDTRDMVTYFITYHQF